MKIHNKQEQELLTIYTTNHLGCNNICYQCQQQNKLDWLPISAWFVGNQFYSDKYKILFIGKSARGTLGNKFEYFSNVFNDGRKLWNKSWPYWSYTRTIVQKLYGDDSAEHIAFTNVVKCNKSLTGDKTTDSMKQYCITQNGFIKNEINILKPNIIIFYTGYNYDTYIHTIFDKFEPIIDSTIANGKVTIPWLEAAVQLNGKNMHLLRTAHPQNKNKEDFVNAIVNWIYKLN